MTNFKSAKNKTLFYLTYLFLYLAISFDCLAQGETPQATPKSLQLKTKGTGYSGIENISPEGFISGAIVLALNISIITFIFMFLVGGYRWIVSSGDEKKVAAARTQITHGLTGLVIILSSWLIMGLIGYLFSIDIFKWTIPSFISPPNTTP